MKFLIELEEVSLNYYGDKETFIEDIKELIPSELGISVLSITVVE